uniref:Uncharacterized protein n=1 Tax=Panagrolaimus sp. PS1159 TaxID=55785 RepID=A0AC35GLC1_9BILA
MKNYSIDIIIFNKKAWNDFTLFDNKSLANLINVEACFFEITPSVFQCKMHLQHLAVVQTKLLMDAFYFGFQVSNGIQPLSSEGCVFKHNVFNINPNKMAISAMASKTKGCKIFCVNEPILADQYYNYIQNLWISPFANGTIKIRSGILEKELVEIDTKSVFLWRDLYSTFYTIDIPPNIAFYITTAFHEYVQPVYNITSHPYKTVVTLPYFGDLDNSMWYYLQPGRDPFCLINVYNFNINLTLLDLDVSENHQIYLEYNDTRIK